MKKLIAVIVVIVLTIVGTTHTIIWNLKIKNVSNGVVFMELFGHNLAFEYYEKEVK